MRAILAASCAKEKQLDFRKIRRNISAVLLVTFRPNYSNYHMVQRISHDSINVEYNCSVCIYDRRTIYILRQLK